MRALRHLFFDIDRQLEDATRAKQQLDAERWRRSFDPCDAALRRTRREARWSRALLKAVVEELYPDDLFAELVGSLDRVPRGSGRTSSRLPSRSATVGGATASRASPDGSASR